MNCAKDVTLHYEEIKDKERAAWTANFRKQTRMDVHVIITRPKENGDPFSSPEANHTAALELV